MTESILILSVEISEITRGRGYGMDWRGLSLKHELYHVLDFDVIKLNSKKKFNFTHLILPIFGGLLPASF